MKCHYEVLSVSPEADGDELKKAYRTLAIKWHPDKNLENTEFAKEQFQIIQKAYEVLSDPSEKARYDKHRIDILMCDSDEIYKVDISLLQSFKDNAKAYVDYINSYLYFSPTCFEGYGDNEKGFYKIYGKVFNKIASVNLRYVNEEERFEYPEFGNSQSSYEEIVKPFYDFWKSYSTKISFYWLKDDIEIMPKNMVRQAEKENKKIIDKAKGDHNKVVRQLVANVRKKDKRIQAVLEERYIEKAKKGQERKQQRLREKLIVVTTKPLYCETCNIIFKRIKAFAKHENDKIHRKNVKLLRKTFIEENNLSRECNSSFQKKLNINEEDMTTKSLYCETCNKMFKTIKSFANHENSKRHRQNVELLRNTLIEEINLSRECNSSSQKKLNIDEEDMTPKSLYCKTYNKMFKKIKSFAKDENSKRHRQNGELLRNTLIEENNLSRECNSSFQKKLNIYEEEMTTKSLYCETCNKMFKTIKSLAKHENSNKHIQNVELLRNTLIEENNLSRQCNSSSQKKLNIDEEDMTTKSHYCETCNKMFKTIISLENHENSKRHRQNVELLRNTLIEENIIYNGDVIILLKKN